jgi:hypothetical protein
MTPIWILDVFAAIMLVVSAVSAGRLALEWPWRPAAHPDVDIAHLLIGISMAGILAARLQTVPNTAWEVIFGTATAWFTWQVVRDATAEGARALAGGHHASYLVCCAAMLYLYLALVTPSTPGMASLSYPTLALAFGLVLAGYSVWDLDQLSGKRYTLARAATALAGPPALAGVPNQAGVLPTAGAAGGTSASSGEAADATPSRRHGSGRGATGVSRGLVLSSRMAVCCRIAIGVTIALTLFVVI